MAEKVDRLTRVNELIKRELAGLFGRGLFSAPGMLVSVTEVITSVDLRNATVHVSIMGGKATDRGNALDPKANTALQESITLIVKLFDKAK